jgi:hypothetical protein
MDEIAARKGRVWKSDRKPERARSARKTSTRRTL